MRSWGQRKWGRCTSVPLGIVHSWCCYLHLPSSRVRTLYQDSQILAGQRKKLTDSTVFPGVFMCFACGSGLMDYSLLLHLVYLKNLTGTEVESTLELLSCASFRSNVMVLFRFCKARQIRWKWRPNKKAGQSCDSFVISNISMHILSASLSGKEFSNSWGTHWRTPKYRCQYKQVEDHMWWIQHGNLSSQALIQYLAHPGASFILPDIKGLNPDKPWAIATATIFGFWSCACGAGHILQNVLLCYAKPAMRPGTNP